MGQWTTLRSLTVAALVSAIGCGGSHWDGQLYRDPEVAFRVGPVPARWRKLQMDAALLAYRDQDSGATIALNGRCGRDGDDVPLTALTEHLFLTFTERQLIAQEPLELDGRAALRSSLSAKLDGVPKQFTLYVLKKDGCVYDFIYIAHAQAPKTAEHDFDAFVRGFSTVERAR